MQIYLVRHGETDWNREMKFQGWADIALNEAGRAQARALAARLKPIPIDAAFCSDLRRAQETAEILLPGRKTPLQPDPLLREMNFGPLEGKPYADARANPESPVHLLFTDPGRYAPPQGAESIPQVVSRFDDFLKRRLRPLCQDPAIRRVLIAAHGVIVRCALTQAGGFSFRDFWQLPVSNCSAAILDFDGQELRLEQMDAKTHAWLI